MRDHLWRVITAIAAITIVETTALITKTDGRFLGLALIAIAGLGGYSLAHLISKRP